MPTNPTLATQLLDALPQTQCTRCGYADCEAYAVAIVDEQAPINQCPPGGEQGIARLAALTGRSPLPLNTAHGTENPRQIMWIDEDWCIGCTLCLKACPVDAIVGSNKRMHTVIESACTGCELCLPACPVDCIRTDEATPGRTGWNAWSAELAHDARMRYTTHQQRAGLEIPGLAAQRSTATARPPATVATAAVLNEDPPAMTNTSRADKPTETTPHWPYRPQQATPLPQEAPVASASDQDRRAAIAAALAKARAQRA